MFDNFPLWPVRASTNAGNVDALYIFLVALSAFMCVAIFTMILVFATVFSFGQAAWGLVGVRRARRAVNRRLATVERTGSLGELVWSSSCGKSSPRRRSTSPRLPR